MVVFSRQSFFFSNSIFTNILNNVISSERYQRPDYNGRQFYSSPPPISGPMVTFRECYFLEIQSLNNNNQPALYSTSQIFRIYTCRFRNCVNTGRGGAIYVNGSDFLLVNDCDFTTCRAESDGGAFYCINSALVVFRNEFRICTSNTGLGGAFMYEDASHNWDLIIQSNLFSNCQARSYIYFYAKFHSVQNNTCYLYFNKFQCLEIKRNDYFGIFTHENNPAIVSEFRNAYGDDVYQIHLSPTKTFSPTPSISPTPQFSPSVPFTPSPVFSLSSVFSQSSQFSLSNIFSPTLTFTPSVIFTPTQPFTLSSCFSPSDVLIPIPTISIPPSPTPNPSTPLATPSQSPSISPTTIFTNSNTFTPAETANATETPTLSKTPCITWPNLSLGLLILLGIILLLGIIANIYLIMLCCKPSEIFVQQVL